MTFLVDSVTPASAALPTDILSESLAFRLQRKLVAVPGADGLVINLNPALTRNVEIRTPSGIAKVIPRRIPQGLVHSLIDAVHIAFSEHRPLILGPDAIWMVIAQGFGHHVAQNSEELRGRLVRHQGKKQLAVEVNDLTLESFEAAVASFSQQIRDQTDQVLHETLICDFSTTTSNIRSASEIALMDTFSSYFTYAMMCVCGIPRITLEGTPGDWRRIRERVEVLATYGLEWWVARLRPILDELIATAEGRPNLDFWKAIYKPHQVYAAEVVTGWIADLFPYLGDAPHRFRNHVFETERRDWILPVKEGVRTGPFTAPPGVARKRFPAGLSSARISLTLPDGTKTELDLLGGFLAVTQHQTDMSLAPLVGWCVAELPPEKPVVVH